MKTHLAIGIFVALFFLQHVTHKTIFIAVVLVATLLPCVDSGFSALSFKKRFKPQGLRKQGGLFHSFTFCILVSLFLAFYFPIIAFPFFLGYGFHLLVDTWTIEGIKPFWPLNQVAKGNVRTGGAIEETIFIIFCILDVLFFALLFV